VCLSPTPTPCRQVINLGASSAFSQFVFYDRDGLHKCLFRAYVSPLRRFVPQSVCERMAGSGTPIIQLVDRTLVNQTPTTPPLLFFAGYNVLGERRECHGTIR